MVLEKENGADPTLLLGWTSITHPGVRPYCSSKKPVGATICQPGDRSVGSAGGFCSDGVNKLSVGQGLAFSQLGKLEINQAVNTSLNHSPSRFFGRSTRECPRESVNNQTPKQTKRQTDYKSVNRSDSASDTEHQPFTH